MLVVNHPARRAHTFAPLRHAVWDALTPADLVFPLFLFVVGLSVALAAARASTRWDGVLARAAVLFGLGVLLNALPFPGWPALRFPGVLQRIAVVYVMCSLLVRRPTGVIVQGIVATALIHTWIHVFGVPGLLSGGWHIGHNPAGRLDRLVFGDHVWGYSPDGDPEGLLSTMGACTTGLIGLLVGRRLSAGRTRPVLLLAMAVAAGAVGWALSVWIPCNKHLWTASFVALTAGGALTLSAFAELVASRPGGLRTALPLLALGRNALPLYVGAIAMERALRAIPWTTVRAGFAVSPVSVHEALTGPFLAAFADARVGSLLWSLVWLLFWATIALGLYARRYRLRIPGA